MHFNTDRLQRGTEYRRTEFYAVVDVVRSTARNAGLSTAQWVASLFTVQYCSYGRVALYTLCTVTSSVRQSASPLQSNVAALDKGQQNDCNEGNINIDLTTSRRTGSGGFYGSQCVTIPLCRVRFPLHTISFSGLVSQ
jgi:hypothetical protein